VAIAVLIAAEGADVGAVVGAVVGVEPDPPEELPVVVELPHAARSITIRRLLTNKNKRR
jgi:hypothetical protein